MKDKRIKSIIAASLMLLFGILFIIYKGAVIGTVLEILTTILGVILIVVGVLDIVAKNITMGVILTVVGALIIIFAWAFIAVLVYILAALMIIYGIFNLIQVLNTKLLPGAKIVMIVEPVLSILIGILLFFQTGDVFNVFAVIIGVILIIEAIFEISYGVLLNKKVKQ